MADISVRFSCSKCRLVDSVVIVPERKEGEDLKTWMKKLTAKMGASHTMSSPRCLNRKAENIKIPMTQKGVGFVTGEKMTQEDRDDLNRELRKMK